MISDFRRNFPGVTVDDSVNPMMASTIVDHPAVTRAMFADDSRNTELTPKMCINDAFRLTPSMMDPNSEAFTSMANQLPSYCTSSPSINTNGLDFHHGLPQPADMTTPGMQTNPLTPDSNPRTTAPLGPPAICNGSFGMDVNLFHPNVPFHTLSQHDYGQQQYAHPSSIHRDPEFEIGDPKFHPQLNGHYPTISFNQSATSLASDHGTPENLDYYDDGNRENFRFHASLRAPTAMIKDPGEIPVTYLNKGQVYTLILTDSDPLRFGDKPLSYRSAIRISFEDQEQRSKPASCWQLWKEGRGMNEAHHRNGKLVAVEHVDPNQGGDGEQRHAQIQLERAAFDGFSVIWTPNRLTGKFEVAISVRFNFLSTDFSHSKGVKGIPVRLCAKTEVLSTTNPDMAIGDGPEVCYCKVKLFRDHGAERKLSNDVTHVKKMIEKHKQQVVQAEIGPLVPEKRKRSASISGKPSKALKNGKNSWAGDSRPVTQEEDLQMKLANLHEMISSNKPISRLDLKGDPQDDPDLYPVQFGISDSGSRRVPESASSKNKGGNVLSPATSDHSVSSSQSPELKKPKSESPAQDDLEFSVSQQDSDNSYSGMNQNNQLVRIQRGTGSDTSSSGSGWFEATDVDAKYKAPSDSQKKPKCCFYIRPQSVSANKANGYYRAIYLYNRTSKDLALEVARKCQFEPSKISRVVRVYGGLEVMLDDDVVEEMPEGQDMVVEFAEIHEDSYGTNQGPMSPTLAQPIEMRLIF